MEVAADGSLLFDLNSNLQVEPATNSECSNALTLQLGQKETGSTLNALKDESIDACVG